MEPELGPLGLFVEAFLELSSCRSIGMGLGPIPFTAVKDYFSIYPIGEDFDEFLYLIRRMDDTYLKDQASKQKAEESKSKKQGAGKSNGVGSKGHKGNSRR